MNSKVFRAPGRMKEMRLHSYLYNTQLFYTKSIMNKQEVSIKTAILTLFMVLVLLYPAMAGQKSRQFSNEDLEKYGRSSDAGPAPVEDVEEQGAAGEDQHTRSYADVDEPQTTRRHIIPYGGTARRIIIPVTFDRHITVPMLLDTGAPGMHVSTRLAKRLGILDKDEGNLMTRIGGIAGSAPAIFTIIDSIQVGEAEDQFIPTMISELKIPGFEGLVGMDFMGKYSMQLDNNKRLLILEELPESPSRPAGHDEQWWRTTFSNFKSMRDAWENYRDANNDAGAYTTSMKELKSFIDKQYSRADYLYNRLNVYASEHSVPLEWR